MLSGPVLALESIDQCREWQERQSYGEEDLSRLTPQRNPSTIHEKQNETQEKQNAHNYETLVETSRKLGAMLLTQKCYFFPKDDNLGL